MRSFVIGLALGVAVSVLTLAALFIFRADPEGKCPAGSFPATNVAVGGDCFRDGTTLPPGWVADPGGNAGLSRTS